VTALSPSYFLRPCTSARKRSLGRVSVVECPGELVHKEFIQVHDYLWKILRQGAMPVPGGIYVSAPMLEELQQDPALD
jgi:hypothetical protein